MSALLDELRHITGAAHVFTDGDLSAFTQDWRRRAHGKALAVVRPGSTDEVAAIVKTCARHQAATGVSLVPQGGNTGLAVGSVPDSSGRQVVLSLTRLNAVRAIDADNLTITVEAGCVLQNVQEAAEAAGYLFPLSLAAEGSCTLGGNLAPTPAAPRWCATAMRASCASAWKWSPHRARSGTACPACARTTPATTCATCSSAAKARWASSPRRR